MNEARGLTDVNEARGLTDVNEARGLTDVNEARGLTDVNEAGHPLPSPTLRSRRQLAAVVRLELRRSLLARQTRAFLMLAAAGLVPFVVAAAHVLDGGKAPDLGQAIEVYAATYQYFILRLLLFFGAGLIFSNTVRDELIGRTLHYLFLVPLSRARVLAGKYLAGLILTAAVMAAEVSAILWLMMGIMPRGGGLEYFLHGGGLGHWGTYVGVVVLGAVTYGAVFLWLGVIFRNPTIPILVLYGWELVNFLLPPLLKQLSVAYHLQALCPISVSEGPFAVLAEPEPRWLAVLVLLALSSAALYASLWAAGRLEVRYDAE